MIKEVEVKNSTELLQSGYEVTDAENTPDIITATLSSNGEVMTIKVNRLLAANFARKVSLFYMMPKAEQQMVAEYQLDSYGPTEGPVIDETTEYVFDLSPVLTEIVHTAPEQLADDTITIRLYTYEANISTDYGTKTLHVPYTVSYPSNYIVPASTDGWYVVRVSDIAVFDIGADYVVGDLVVDSAGTFTCIANSTGNATTDETYWEALDEDTERNLFEFGHEESDTIQTLLNTNMLVTRYVKQKHIYEMLLKTNYKRYDNITVVSQLEKIYSMREAAVIYLKQGDPIAARTMLDMITIEVNTFTLNKGERRVVETITNFTV